MPGLWGLCAPVLASCQGDPLEPVKRAIFAFNRVADKVVLVPAARVYQGVTPKPARTGVRHFLNNLQSPVILVNDLLQGKFKRAAQPGFRSVLNSTVGLGGVLDVARAAGVPRHYEDLGQTLAGRGVPPGPCLVVPLLGPRNARALAGLVFEQTLLPTSAGR